MVNQTYPHELQLSKLIFLIPKPSFLDDYLSIFQNGFVSSKVIVDKRDDFFLPFWMVTFPVLPLRGLYFLTFSSC